MGMAADWALQKGRLVNLAAAVGTVQNETQKDFKMNRSPGALGPLQAGWHICNWSSQRRKGRDRKII